MGIVKRIILWWKTTPATDKILYALSGVSTAAAIVSAYSSIKTRKIVSEEMNIEVKLYPGGKDDPDPVDLKPENPPKLESKQEDISGPKMKVDTSSDKWVVWDPDWEPVRKSESGYESVRLADALDVLQRIDGMMQSDGYCESDDVCEAEARVEDLARQFAYLEGCEDEFRKRFPYLKDHASDIYENAEV